MSDKVQVDLESLIADARSQADAFSARTAPPPDIIRGYELIRELHRGGQGVVYLAHQRATHRNVAIKILREGPFAGPAERARFEREVQILAALRHPHIVAIHDSGCVLGNFFFVMDYIAGLPLDQWSEQQRARIPVARSRLAAREPKRGRFTPILATFIKICDAVNMAHQRGVIHRDLKPTNIRVDGDDEPFVLDFGLAKVTSNGETTADSVHITATGDFLGTLPWSSPEQVVGTSYHADVRSDVYALGLMLYQSIVGKMPYSMESSVVTLIHAITQEEPSRPRNLVKGLDEDLETIVLKCLRKDPDRRYQSMAAVADDLRRYLSFEPIAARRESGWYSLRMFARRHRMAVAFTSILMALLLGASISLAYLFLRAKASEQLALRRADEIKRVAEFQAAQLAGIDISLMGLRIRDDLLAQAGEGPVVDSALLDQDSGQPPRPSATPSLEQAIQRVNFTDLALQALDENIFQGALVAIDQQFKDQPAVRGTLLQTVADTMRRLGLVDRATVPQQTALQIRRETLGPEHPDTLTSLHQTAMLLAEQGNLSQAIDGMEQVLESRRRLLGEEHADTLASLNELGTLLQSIERFDEALDIHGQTLEIRQRLLGDEHPDALTSLANLGSLHHQRGELDKAAACYQEALPLMRRVFGNEHPETLTVINNLGHLLRTQGQWNDALAYLQEALDIRRHTLGDRHPRTLNSIDNLAGLLALRGRLDEAITLRHEALDGYRASLGELHPHTLRSLNGMAHVLSLAGRLDEAKPLAEQALELHRRVLGNDHTQTIVAIKNMGRLLQQTGAIDEAATYFDEALQLSRRVVGNEHPDTTTALAELGGVHAVLGRFDEAETCLQEALETNRRNLGSDHPQTLDAMVKLGGVSMAQQEFEDALALFQVAEDSFRQSLGGNHPNTLAALMSRGAALKGMERWDEALACYREGRDGYRRALGDDHPFTLRAVNLLGELSMARGDNVDARRFFQESYADCQRALGASHPETLRSGINLGLALCRLEQFDEAEEYLIEAATHGESLPPQHNLRTRFIQSLVELYEAWDGDQRDGVHAAEAEKWRAQQSEASLSRDDE